MAIKIYGIRNCDTIKKAMIWAEDFGLTVHLHDYRKDGLDGALLQSFIDALGWEALLNTRGTTWRKLDDEMKANMTEGKAKALMLEHVAMIKRPVWSHNGKFAVGFATKEREGLRKMLDI